MEGVGARFGRSSTRYGAAATTSTVFTGPVRKWHKKWVHVAPNPNITANTPSSNHKHKRNGTDGASSSHLLFYKWAPVKNGDVDSKDNVVQDPPRRKFRYVPVAVLEEQQSETAEREAEEKAEGEAKPNLVKLDGTTLKNGVIDEKPDINDVPMEENQDVDEAGSTRQTVNLGFNLNSDEGDPESDTNADEK